eukprot:352610-Chlamydomonas_euryale.AAC.4
MQLLPKESFALLTCVTMTAELAHVQHSSPCVNWLSWRGVRGRVWKHTCDWKKAFGMTTTRAWALVAMPLSPH